MLGVVLKLREQNGAERVELLRREAKLGVAKRSRPGRGVESVDHCVLVRSTGGETSEAN